ncbi:hypothetical protein ABIB57_001401 [Devosia sp. UYZn731]|uniref:hypothetical protein n=1 Tax=Devosia sp. UYZn731 TaxID=3156345 RepID=UPI003398F05F
MFFAMKMAETLALRNERALLRFNKALPEVFPEAVLTHAMARRWTPPTPRLAVDSYWRTHPLRADRLARALAAKSGTPEGWTWRLRSADEPDLAPSFRMPPAPYRQQAFSRGPGHCVVCGQPVYRLGWHVDLWGKGPNKNAVWHTACVTAWQMWTAPSNHAKLLRKLQTRRCATSGARLLRTSEVDHRTPLFRVWHEHRDTDWPTLLNYWGLPNLQVINRDAHVEKSSAEATTRRRGKVVVGGEGLAT